MTANDVIILRIFFVTKIIKYNVDRSTEFIWYIRRDCLSPRITLIASFIYGFSYNYAFFILGLGLFTNLRVLVAPSVAFARLRRRKLIL